MENNLSLIFMKKHVKIFRPVIGVLDIQGSVEEHIESLKKLGLNPLLVKFPEDIAKLDGLIIPGGESTTLSALLKKSGLYNAIRKRKNSLSVWGTCAGAILLAKKVKQYNSWRKPKSLKLLDYTVQRNAYGRQTDSFESAVSIDAFKNKEKNFPAIFIRAPKVLKVGKKADVLARHGGEPVMVRQGKFLATMFHPELTQDLRIHEYFVEMCK